MDAAAYHLLVDGQPVASAPNAIGLVPHIVHALDTRVIERLALLHAVHAGTVAWKGRALLVPGGSHAGKSSLVAELIRRGASYYSDEYALIDEDGRVHPYPRPLLLRNGNPEQTPHLAAEFGAQVGCEPAPVRWIFSLQYRSGGGWNVAEVSQSVGLLSLLKNTPHVLGRSPAMIRSFQRAVANAANFVGERADVGEAADRILQLIDASD